MKYDNLPLGDTQSIAVSVSVKIFFVFIMLALISPAAMARSFIVSNNSQLSQNFLVVNGSTGYTGIGTGNPLYPLDIVGNIRWSDNLTGGNVPWARLTEFPVSCGVDEAVRAIGGTLTCVKLNSTSGNTSGSGTPNYTAKFISENIIGNSIIYDNGASIGIGTATPQNKLNVIGDINATGSVYGMTSLCIGTDCRTAWSELLSPWDNSSTQTFIRAGYPLLINASNTLFVNGSAGKVGIGTINPTSALEVVGTINVTNITLRTNCNNGQILKWSNGAGTCGSDIGEGGEVDTLQNVTDRGNYTLNSIIIGASTTPVRKLDVVGDINATVGLYGVSIYQNSYKVLDNGTSFTGGNVTGLWNALQLASGSVGASQIINGAIDSSKLVADLNLGWSNLTNYPANCSAGQVVTGFNDTQVICTTAGTGDIMGVGTQNYLAKFTESKTLANSTVYEESGLVGINTSTPQNTLSVVGTFNVTTGNSVLALDSNGDLTFGI